MKRKYYILSFKNGITGEVKEYYKCTDENIRKIAIQLVETFDLNKEITEIHIYELKEVIYNDEY